VESYSNVSEDLLKTVQKYISECHLEALRKARKHWQEQKFLASPFASNLDEPFSATLLRLIDQSGEKDAEIYQRANIDRRLFSKIRSNPDYMPSKPTILALAIALKLPLEHTEDLLKRAGYSLSHSQKFDVIIEYFIRNNRYNIFEINEVLFHYDQPILGG